MKKVRQINGYTVYQAATQRDADNYNCEIGNYNVYLSSDIRDFGLAYSDAEWENEDSLAVVIARCEGSKYAVAAALAEELSGSTAQDMDLVLEIERRLDKGQSLEQVTRELGPCILDDEDLGDDEDLDGDLEDVLDAALAEKPSLTCRDWMQRVHPDRCGRDYHGGCCGCPSDYIPGATAPDSVTCQHVSCTECWDLPLPAGVPAPGPKPRSHASYAVLRDPDTGDYETIAPPHLSESIRTAEQANRCLLTTVAKHYAFSDCGGWEVDEIVIDGDPVEYAGWLPGMEYRFTNTRTGEIIYDVWFPEWDH